MTKEMIISASPHQTKVALVEEGQVVEVYLEREKEFGLAGSIYRGRVTRVLPGMQSAFVNIGLDRDAFLYVSDFFEGLEEYEHEASAPAQPKEPPPEEPAAKVEASEAAAEKAPEPAAKAEVSEAAVEKAPEPAAKAEVSEAAAEKRRSPPRQKHLPKIPKKLSSASNRRWPCRNAGRKAAPLVRDAAVAGVAGPAVVASKTIGRTTGAGSKISNLPRSADDPTDARPICPKRNPQRLRFCRENR